MLEENNQSSTNKKGKKVIKKLMTVVFPDKVVKSNTAKRSDEFRFHEKSRSNSVDHITDLSKRSHSLSSMPKLEYNPYGIFKHHDIVNLEQAFGTRFKISEPEHRLSNPLSLPNEFLPMSMQQKHLYLEEKYELLDIELGSGGSATIKKVLLKNEKAAGPQTEVFALKKFSLFDNESQKDYYQRVAHEFIITKSILHQHSIQCYDLLQLPVTLQNAWGMTMDYFEYDLFKLIKAPNWKNVDFNEKMCIFKQVSFGLKFLHENDLVHLDIKPENIMVSKNGLMKITDYGCVELGHIEHKNFESPVLTLKKRLGTPPFQPPEVARFSIVDEHAREPYCPFLFDYWSLGMLLFFVVTGKSPFANCKETDPGFKLYTLEYVRMTEKMPLFLDDVIARIPKIGVFSDPHGQNPLFLYFFWRLCDPNSKTRMTIPKLFKMKEFQEIEMCVDENLYEANFYCHLGSKSRTFKIAFGDHNEITLQNEVKHSSWDDIPTIPNSYDGSQISNFLLPQATDERSRKFKNDVNESYFGHGTTCLCYQGEHPSVSTSDDNYDRTKHDALPLSHHEPSCMKHPLPDISTRQFAFSDSDYNTQSATKFMIVKYEDIVAASNCEIAAHSHNCLYSYDRRRSHTISAMSSQLLGRS